MNGNSYRGFSEAFAIFAKYEEGEFDTDAEHDEIFSGPSPKIVSTEDTKRLQELGWSPEESLGRWRRFV